MRRAFVVLAALSLLLTAAIQPVAAGSSFYHSRSSGHFLQFSWIQLDTISGTDTRVPPGAQPRGNTHIGNAFAFSTSTGLAMVHGQIADLDCPVDFIPPFGGGHGGFQAFVEDPEPPEPPENPCTHIGFRQIFGDGIPLSIDRKLTSARLGGPGVTIGIYGAGDDPHGGPGELIANVPINTVFTGIGATAKSTFTSTWSDGVSSYSSRYSSTDRQAEMSGILGPMGYAPGLSGGFMSSYREMSRGRTR